MSHAAVQTTNRQLATAGLKAAFVILNKWGCSAEQAMAILRLPKATYYKYFRDPESARLNEDQLERLSYLVNIHAHLRLLFENPENQYGFMSMKNNNPFFNGRSPLEVIETGSFAALYETHQRIDALRGGQW
jgi:hypothetical protein